MSAPTLPQSAITKLLALDDGVNALTNKSVTMAARIDYCRRFLDNRIEDRRVDPQQMLKELRALIEDQKRLEQRLRVEKTVLARCREWLDRLPPGARLDEAMANPTGHDLVDIRQRIAARVAEISALENAPVPSPDIRQRIAARVAEFGMPSVSGVDAGQQIKIIWPGAVETRSGLDERSCDLMAMMALLFPDKLVDAAMAEVERMATDPLPVAERPARIAALAREVEELALVEEALVAGAIVSGEAVHRNYDANPAAVLGVRTRK